MAAPLIDCIILTSTCSIYTLYMIGPATGTQCPISWKTTESLPALGSGHLIFIERGRGQKNWHKKYASDILSKKSLINPTDKWSSECYGCLWISLHIFVKCKLEVYTIIWFIQPLERVLLFVWEEQVALQWVRTTSFQQVDNTKPWRCINRQRKYDTLSCL